MAKLSATQRAKLPDRAFAYLASDGKRSLPIHDEAHVRNALARFDRVRFESDEARDRARHRLLNAAKKFRIVPVGFVTGQLRFVRRGPDLSSMPTGRVTFMLDDDWGGPPGPCLPTPAGVIALAGFVVFGSGERKIGQPRMNPDSRGSFPALRLYRGIPREVAAA